MKSKRNSRPGRKKTSFSFRSSPFAWMLLLLLVSFLVFVPGLYSDTLGLGLQRGMLITITLQAALAWLSVLALLYFGSRLLIRMRKEIVKQYPAFFYALCWFALLAVAVLILGFFETPRVTSDLFHYYAQGAIEERISNVAATNEVCNKGGRTTTCTLWIELEDGSRYATKGALSDLFEQRADVKAIRILPLSRRIVGVRTEEGWM
ncbi:hypothetical protein [Saccharibacillus alkalitolerans]|uniref:Uncharacterized protein n=1 Tax=Saccharibacillus alkalitolerans TaxID=2705290 RepID=A0ABX0F4R1_9BACL|nr:hypothetical protein [Saccharibacillus alkalitolerans]NGZ75677.1 hypothetical protein [Saccharibacillus alkalitolerans]